MADLVTDGFARVMSISNDEVVVLSLLFEDMGKSNTFSSEGDVVVVVSVSKILLPGDSPPLPKYACPIPPPLALASVVVSAADESRTSTTRVKLGFKIPLATASLSAFLMLSLEVRRRRRGD